MSGAVFGAAVRRTLGRCALRSPGSLSYVALVATLTILPVSVWWAAELLPLQDYPQFLVFVRAVRDMGTPGSPFHGTYTVAPWFTPTGLPVHLTSLLATISGGSVERGGRLLLSLQGLGLVASSIFLLRTIGASRWNIVLLFPLMHSYWTLGGFTAFATAVPLVILGAAVAIRWFRSQTTAMGICMAVLLSVTLFWHGIAFMMSGLTFGVLWLLQRFPSRTARIKAAVPSMVALAHYVIWTRTTFSSDAKPSPPEWQAPWDAADSFLIFASPQVPHPGARSLILFLLVLGTALAGATRSPFRVRRQFLVENPFLFVAITHVAAYFLLPINVAGVAGLSNRFPYLAELFLVFAWRLPRRPAALVSCVVLVASFALWGDIDMLARFRRFDARTRGASHLIDRIEEGKSLYWAPTANGAVPEFPGQYAAIELQQFATARKGGLPNSSFAGYGYTFVRYVNGINPMPQLYGHQTSPQALAKFDYVLVGRAQTLRGVLGFQAVAEGDGWELYAVQH